MHLLGIAFFILLFVLILGPRLVGRMLVWGLGIIFGLLVIATLEQSAEPPPKPTPAITGDSPKILDCRRVGMQFDCMPVRGANESDVDYDLRQFWACGRRNALEGRHNWDGCYFLTGK